MNDIVSEFLKEIKKFGKYKNLGRMSGVSRRTIEQWVYNGTQPTLINAQKVANALGL